MEVCRVEDMNYSIYVNEDPCQGEMPTVRSPSIPKKDLEVINHVNRH